MSQRIHDLDSFVAGVLAGDLVRDVCQVLRPWSIPVAPLKGVLLQRTVYSDVAQRRVTDVDLLVRPRDFERACDALAAAGFAAREVAGNPHERVLARARAPLSVDLHCELFAPHRYRLDAEGLFTRARPDLSLFGVEVCVADPRDQYAHLVGHFANDHAREDDRMHLGDLAALASHHRLDPGRTAEHLAEHGLARAARYTLGFAVEVSSDCFAAAVLAALPPDPVGDLLARAAHRTVRRVSRSSPWASLAAHAVNTSLPHAARSILWATRHRLTTRL